MTAEKRSPGDLDSETQCKICANVFKKALDSMLIKGFNPEDVVSGLLATTLYVMQAHGLNYDHKEMAAWLHNFAQYLDAKDGSTNHFH